MPAAKVRRQDLLYKELSYEIVGCAFAVFNEIGPGQQEATYHKALAIALENAGIKSVAQAYRPIYFQGELVGKNFFDLLVDDKILVELKRGSSFSRDNIEQVVRYLKTSDLKLGLLINFGTHGVQCKRIPNE